MRQVIWSFCNEGGCEGSREQGGPRFQAIAQEYDGSRATLANMFTFNDLLSKTIEVQGRILAAKSKIDEKLGIDDAGFRYPEATITFRESASFQVGELPVEVRFLHGHSNCTSVVLLPTLKTMCTADYLVAPGLPYCRWQAHEFEQALATMRRWCDEENIERIIPAHDKPLIGRPAIDAALDEEVRYFEFLRAHVRERIAAGDSRERCARTAATTMTERRGLDLRGRERQDLDNAKRVLVEEWQGD